MNREALILAIMREYWEQAGRRDIALNWIDARHTVGVPRNLPCRGI